MNIHTAISLTIALLAGTVLYAFAPRAPQATNSITQQLSSLVETAIPQVLDDGDRLLYTEIFDAQERGGWMEADMFISKLSDPVLMGHVLAERYLHPDYKTSPAELSAWLDKYSDHPQAYDIYRLAKRKAPASVESVAEVSSKSLRGYGDDNGLARGESKAVRAHWESGLADWKVGKHAQAAKHFAAILEEKKLSPWTESAAAYWAYRAYDASGDDNLAETYLEFAAENSRSFYGVLARRQLGESLLLDTTPITLHDEDMLSLIDQPATVRIIALAECGKIARADKEMRALFPKSDEEMRVRLLALSHRLGLASVQITMARQLENDDRGFDLARYPVPHWQPEGGFKIDPALIYALARQESGFNINARSPAGAFGLMQLMPSTASMMEKRFNVKTATMDETELNLTLGQNYVVHLLQSRFVEGNMIYMLAAYNAGPARLIDWKKRYAANDPLLFLESIPYGETRNYVKQVMTNYWIYSELAGNPSPTVISLAQNEWPGYAAAMDIKLSDNNS